MKPILTEESNEAVAEQKSYSPYAGRNSRRGRVIEIPTPRWTTYDAARFGIELGEEVPRTTQERAYTSPIRNLPTAPSIRRDAHTLLTHRARAQGSSAEAR